jgi:hypothetical protein
MTLNTDFSQQVFDVDLLEAVDDGVTLLLLSALDLKVFKTSIRC